MYVSLILRSIKYVIGSLLKNPHVFFSIDDTLILDSDEFLLDGSLHVVVEMQILDETRHIDPTCYRRKISWRIQNFGLFTELIQNHAVTSLLKLL